MSEDLSLLDLNDEYRSDVGDVVGQFYVPVLSSSTSYDRAVGYFTSTSLALFSRGLDRLIDAGGRVRLVASPHLLPEDAQDLARGYEVREIVERAALRELENISSESIGNGLGYLGRLVASGQLDMKLAFLRTSSGLALYHEKIGVARDGSGHAVAFTGSANETLGGLLANFESIQVYRSWDFRDVSRVERIAANFDRLWANQTDNLEVLTFPSVVDRVVEMGRSPDAEPMPDRDDGLERIEVQDARRNSRRLTLPASFEPRDYQKEAVEAWFGGGFRGIFKMATGTGKTKTALTAATKLGDALQRQELPLATVVVVPYQHLVDQWVDELSSFGVSALALYDSSRGWVDSAAAIVDACNLGQIEGAQFVTTTATFCLPPFQDLLARLNSPLLVIGDEVHNLGSSRVRSRLPGSARYRLGLSATPERWFDDVGTAAIKDYFGDVVFEFSMARAIEAGALCRYTYRPRLVTLDEDETVLYGELTDAIGALLASGDDAEDDDSPLGQLLRKRSGVLGHAAGKLPALTSDLAARKDQSFQLLYCAEGRRPTDEGYEEGPRQLDQALKLVGTELGIPAHKYVSETPRDERRSLLRRFGSGDDLRMLVSMRCLDEGVDIPDARIAYVLASSSNPRQFIQRRGRLLRPAPGKERAEIIDYLAVPGELDEGRFETERRLMERELTRATEFAQLAENYGEALDVLRDLKIRYQLLDI